MDTDSMDRLILSNPFLTQNAEMWLAHHNTPGKFTDSGFKFVSLFLFNKILRMYL